MSLQRLERMYGSNQNNPPISPYERFKRRGRKPETAFFYVSDTGFENKTTSHDLEFPYETIVLLQWLNANAHYFPFLGEGLIGPKTGTNHDVTLSIEASSFPNQYLTSISILFAQSSYLHTKINPVNGDFILLENTRPDFSFFNAQLIFQLLIAQHIFQNKKEWNVVLKKIDQNAVDDFFDFLPQLYIFARQCLYGKYPEELFFTEDD